MTSQELNRDVKRLLKSINDAKAKFDQDNDAYYSFIENKAKGEFLRLYRADKTFEYMNKQSVLIMLRLNVSHRFEPLHVFGIQIEL